MTSKEINNIWLAIKAEAENEFSDCGYEGCIPSLWDSIYPDIIEYFESPVKKGIQKASIESKKKDKDEINGLRTKNKQLEHKLKAYQNLQASLDEHGLKLK